MSDQEDQPVVILGAGAQGRVAVAVLRSRSASRRIVFADANPDGWGTTVEGCPVVGDLATALREVANPGVFIALGHNARRYSLGMALRSEGVPIVNAVHATSWIADTAELGCGILVGASAVINVGARIGDFCVINTGVIVEHDCRLEDGVNLSPGATVGGRCEIGGSAFVGLGATVVSRTRIGANSVVGAGSLVIARVPPATMVWGSPARRWRKVDETFDWDGLG